MAISQPSYPVRTDALVTHVGAYSDTLAAALKVSPANTRTSNYILAVSDQDGVVAMNVATANSLTIPPDATANLPVGSIVRVLQMGAGQTTISPGSGVTLTSLDNNTGTAGQSAMVTLWKRAANTWVAFGDLTSVTAPPPVTADLYVSPSGNDANNGTSPAQAVRQLNRANALASPGDVISVAAGSYSACTLSTAGTSSARITYLAEIQHAAVINSVTSRPITVTGSYIDVEGIAVTGPNGIDGNGTNVGIWVQATNSRLIRCRVYNCPIPPDGSNGGTGILLTTTDFSSCAGMVAYGCLVESIGVGSANAEVHGIYWSAPGGALIANNLVREVDGWGLHSWHSASGAIVVNNTTVYCLNGGIIINTDGSHTGTDTKVWNNISAHGDGIGMSDGSAINTDWRNNTCYDYTQYLGPAGQLGSGSTQTGSLTSNPLFVADVNSTSGDFRLQSGSPSRNTGYTGTDTPAFDIVATPRPQGTAVDRGCYEQS